MRCFRAHQDRPHPRPELSEAEYADLFSRQNMSIDVTISPEIEVGKMVLRRISFPGATDVVKFADDHIAMVAIECMGDCPVVATPLHSSPLSFRT